MSIETNDQSHETGWTLERISRVAARLVMISAPGIASYHVGDLLPVAIATTPNPVNANGRAPTPVPAVTAPPPALIELPPEVVVAPLKDANGASFNLADFFGKVIVINIWATWCGPCRREIPELVKLHKEFQSRGVEMIGLTTENPDASAEKVRKFMQDFQIDYRIGWAPGEVAATLMQGRQSIPQSLVISRDAFLIHRFVGFSPANTSTQLKQALEDALK
jgi:thiol-disulfide isomerase/thioredoxin